MLNLSNRLGIFVKERKKGRSYKTRYFFIDNNYNLIYTSNQAFIEKEVKSSETINEIIYKLSYMKKICFKSSKIGLLKLFATLESIPLAHKNCFELFIEASNDINTIDDATGIVNTTVNNIIIPLIIFSAQDDDIGYLHDFIKNYDIHLEKIKKKQLQVPLSIRNSINKNDNETHSPSKIQHQSLLNSFDYSSEKKFKHASGQLNTHVSGLYEQHSLNRIDEEYNETFNMLLSLIEVYDEKMNQIRDKDYDYFELIEDLLSNKNVELEEHQLSKLENGSSYSGKMRNGKPYGQGTEFIKDGISYVGEFRNGKMHGLGYIVNSNLDMTYAEFINGRPVGI